MSDFDPRRAAGALHDSRAGREKLTSLPAEIAPRTPAEAAAVQHALAERTGQTEPGGFKIGATAIRMQEYLGLSGPAAGFMSTGGIHRSGVSLPFASFVHPGVECELAVRLARDLPAARCTRDQAADAVGDLFAAIEIVENRYGDLAELGAPTLIADQVFHAAAVLGQGLDTDWRALEVGDLRGRISVDGHERDQGVASDLLGHPFQCLAWLAGSEVAVAFGGLRAGQVVLLGSVTPPVWLQEPARVSVEFAGLPSVLLTFSATEN
jgi:2-keto-4-pentenoate hydratase